MNYEKQTTLGKRIDLAIRPKLLLLANLLNHPRRTCRNLARHALARKDARKILKENAIPRRVGKTRHVYFFGRYDSISFRLGGSYLIETLRRMGVSARSGYFAPLESICASIAGTLLFGKRFPSSVAWRNARK